MQVKMMLPWATKRSCVITAKTRIDIALLGSLPLLGSASDEHKQKLAAAASRRTASSRTILFAEGSRVEHLFILALGAVELFSEQGERRFTISVVRATHALNVSSLFAGRYPLSARVLESAEFVCVPVKLMIELIACDSGLADAMARKLTSESLQIIEDFKKHRLLKTTARIAHWMLHSDNQSGGSGQIVIPFDKRVLASYLGMTPEQLSRGFATLGSAGVTVDGRMVSIGDRATLTRIAHREQ
jgi:CRP/FNR family transcriptional activator FtrB